MTLHAIGAANLDILEIVITHFVADTITYVEPTIPPKLDIERKELFILRIFYIHHQTTILVAMNK